MLFDCHSCVLHFIVTNYRRTYNPKTVGITSRQAAAPECQACSSVELRRISAVQPYALKVHVGRVNAGKARTIAFSDIVVLKRQPATHNPVLAWVAAGAIVAVVVIAVSVLLIERRNERGSLQMLGDCLTDQAAAQARAKPIHMSGNLAFGEV